MGTATLESHVHRRPGGAVADAECRCSEPAAWPIPDEAAEATAPAVSSSPRVAVSEVAPSPERPDELRRPVRFVGAAARTRSLARGVIRRIESVARRQIRRLASMAVRVTKAVGRTLWVAGAASLSVFVAFVMSLGGAAQVAGVSVGTWAAWEIDATAGRLVLAVGLLFLGGAIGRVVREVRNGSTG